jgi:hypothetical protein
MIVCLILDPLAHAAPPEVENTGDLVVRYSQRLNEQLQAFEKSLQDLRAGRTRRARASIESARAYEAYTANIRDLWAVSQDKTAQQLFDSVRATRKKLPAGDASAPKDDTSAPPQQTPLYNPEPLETTIKRVMDLTRPNSAKERATFAFDFAKSVWEQVKKQQDTASKIAAEANK